MIVFDGVDMMSVAPVRIEDIHVSPIELSPVSRARAVNAGSVFVRNRFGTRTVTISFAILTENKVQRRQAIDGLTAWAKMDREYRLELPTEPEGYLMCVCTGRPNPSTRQWWESRLQLVFTCFSNPFWTDKNEKTVSCGTQFTVLGDAPPLMKIQRTLSGNASEQSYTLDDRTITFSTIPSGNLTIDLEDETAYVGDESIMQYYNVNSRFLIPRTGAQTISGTGTVRWRERWQ